MKYLRFIILGVALLVLPSCVMLDDYDNFADDKEEPGDDNSNDSDDINVDSLSKCGDDGCECTMSPVDQIDDALGDNASIDDMVVSDGHLYAATNSAHSTDSIGIFSLNDGIPELTYGSNEFTGIEEIAVVDDKLFLLHEKSYDVMAVSRYSTTSHTEFLLDDEPLGVYRAREFVVLNKDHVLALGSNGHSGSQIISAVFPTDNTMAPTSTTIFDSEDLGDDTYTTTVTSIGGNASYYSFTTSTDDFYETKELNIRFRDQSEPVVVSLDAPITAQIWDDAYLYTLTRGEDSSSVSIFSPTTGNVVSTYTSINEVGQMHLHESLLYLVGTNDHDWSDSIEVVDVSSAASPKWIGYYETEVTLEDIAFDGDFVYVADGEDIIVLETCK